MWPDAPRSAAGRQIQDRLVSGAEFDPSLEYAPGTARFPVNFPATIKLTHYPNPPGSSRENAGVSAPLAALNRPATVRQITVCGPKTAEFMPVTFLQLTMAQGENIMLKRIKQLARKRRPPKRRTQPLPEEDLGGGDICSLQEQPSTDDDQPLD